MKTIKNLKLLCTVLGASTLLAAPNLFATISYNGTYTGTVQLTTDYGSALTATTSGLGSFDTFCLNEGVDANPSTTYNYVSSDTVIPSPTGFTDPIVLGTAWLYSGFRSGALANYTYGSAGSANDLQSAIWYLQGNAVGVNNYFVTEAQAALTLLGLGSVTGVANGAFGVFALTLTDGQGNSAQPVLGMVPEPSTVVAGMLLLLPFAVSTVRIMRKNKVA
jgi:hypothetical protein